MRIDPNGAIVLSERNLLALLHKLRMEGSGRTIYKNIPARDSDGSLVDYEVLTIRAETNEEHYGCPRVNARIECPECGYPFSEARYGLHEVDDPGHRNRQPGGMHPDTEEFIANYVGVL